MRAASDPSGTSRAPSIRQIAHSCGSRTSMISIGSPASRRRFSSAAPISSTGSASSPLPVPQKAG